MAKASRSQPFSFADSYLNLIVGIIIVVAIAALVVGFIRGRTTQQPGGEKEQQKQTVSEEQASLPTKHKVVAGEDLWKISDKYYKTGYNWIDIAKANNLSNPNNIAEGMELTIPNVTPKVLLPSPTITSVPEKAAQPAQATGPIPAQLVGEAITGTSYTVTQGDYLWEIAIRTYGDGYKWVDIARANKLDNPDVIHPGNVLTIPR